MRVGLVIYGRLDKRSGGFLYDCQLVRYLRQQGDEVTVISLPWQSYGRHLTHNFSPVLWQQLANGRFHILLQDELNHPSLFLLNKWLRARHSSPNITIVHHLRQSEARPAWQNRLYRVVERAYLASVDGYIFNSHTTRQAAAAVLGQVARPYVVAPPAGDRFGLSVDEAEITRRAHADGPLRLLFVGNIMRRKGLHTLLAAVAQLPVGCVELAVVGETAVEPSYYRSLQLQLAALGERVTVYGRLPDTSLSSLMQKSHVLVVPSSYEGFGIVYLEGMGAGLPAVATTEGGVGEIVTNGVNGFLIPPEDEQMLAQKLFRLHQNRPQLAAMGRAALARWRQHPAWADSMARIRAFLLRQC
ncbi:MAG: hypothetical protein Kow0080_30860 [Candidatus Promineifilaceae bacterium]